MSKRVERLLPKEGSYDFPVSFYTTESYPAQVGIQIESEEPSTLWISKKVGREVFRDLIEQGYVREEVTT